MCAALQEVMTIVHETYEGVASPMTSYALLNAAKLQSYALQAGGIASLFIGISSAKPVRDKRLEFFRESGSGYSITAFFLAICSVSTLEYAIDITIAALLAIWIRSTILQGILSFIVHCIFLSWTASAWGLFYSTWVAPGTVFLVVGLHMVISMFLCGAASSVTFEDFSKQGPEYKAINAITGLIAPVRFFVESYVVNEEMCLPPQSGFTSDTLSLMNRTGFKVNGYAPNDPNVPLRSCGGWYWNVLPMFLVGFTIRFISLIILHSVNRKKMPKTP